MPRRVHLHRHGVTGPSLALEPACPLAGDKQAGGGDEAGVGHHPVVGTHRAPLDVPGAPQDLEGLRHGEAAVLERAAEAPLSG